MAAGENQGHEFGKVSGSVKTGAAILGALSLAPITFGLFIFIAATANIMAYSLPPDVSQRMVTALGIAIGIPSLASGIGMAFVNREAVYGIFQKPLSATWYVIIAALAEGVALYGLVISFMIVGKHYDGMGFESATFLISAGIAVGLGVIGAVIGIIITIKNSGKEIAASLQVGTWVVIIAALAEGVALYGFVIAFMIIGKVDFIMDHTSGKMIYSSAWIFGGLLVLSGLLVGFLPTKIADGSDTNTWIKKIILAAVGESVALIALVWMFMAIGRV